MSMSHELKTSLLEGAFLNSILLRFLVLYLVMLEKGLVQIYTGDGKGKTTAALGLALRAAGQGNNVLIYQFLKPASLRLGERLALQSSNLPITIDILDAKWDIASSEGNPADVAAAKAAIAQALEKLTETVRRGNYDVVILDEIVYCLSNGLAEFEDVKRLINNKHSRCELVLTGRGASESLIELTDLVTEMKLRKHPYKSQSPEDPKNLKNRPGSFPARKGIEF
jgi:cob(I)alamin adenosyltransferase